MTVSSKIRIYDLAKELKLDTKRLIEEVRREGVDVSVPSNSVSKELAEKIRNKYFPKKETAVKRGVRVVKRAERAVEEAPALEASEIAADVVPQPEVAEREQPEVAPPTAAPDAAKPAKTAKLIRKLTPAVRAEQPVTEEFAAGVPHTPIVESAAEIEEANGNFAEPAVSESTASPAATSAAPAPTAQPPSRQVKVLRPTVAALNAGIRPGERAPSPVVPPSITPRERAERGTRVRERTPLAKTERRKRHISHRRMQAVVARVARRPAVDERSKVKPAASTREIS